MPQAAAVYVWLVNCGCAASRTNEIKVQCQGLRIVEGVGLRVYSPP